MAASRVAISSLTNGTILQAGTYLPAVGATAFVYQHGTTTQVTVFSAESGGTTLPQPLTADANGQLPGYLLAEQNIDIVATFNGQTGTAGEMVPLNATDIVAIPSGTTAGDLLVGSGATFGRLAIGDRVGKQVIVRSDGTLGYVDAPKVPVTAWGAVGDGVTDDTVAIKNAMAAAGAISGEVEFPFGAAGSYLITSPLPLVCSMTARRPGRVRIRCAAGTWSPPAWPSNTGQAAALIDLNVSISGVSGNMNLRVENLKLDMGTVAGAVGTSDSNGVGAGFVVFRNCELVNGSPSIYAVYAPNGTGAGALTATRWENCDWVNVPLWFYSGTDHDDILIEHCRFMHTIGQPGPTLDPMSLQGQNITMAGSNYMFVVASTKTSATNDLPVISFGSSLVTIDHVFIENDSANGTNYTCFAAQLNPNAALTLKNVLWSMAGATQTAATRALVKLNLAPTTAGPAVRIEHVAIKTAGTLPALVAIYDTTTAINQATTNVQFEGVTAATALAAIHASSTGAGNGNKVYVTGTWNSKVHAHYINMHRGVGVFKPATQPMLGQSQDADTSFSGQSTPVTTSIPLPSNGTFIVDIGVYFQINNRDVITSTWLVRWIHNSNGNAVADAQKIGTDSKGPGAIEQSATLTLSAPVGGTGVCTLTTAWTSGTTGVAAVIVPTFTKIGDQSYVASG